MIRLSVPRRRATRRYLTGVGLVLLPLSVIGSHARLGRWSWLDQWLESSIGVGKVGAAAIAISPSRISSALNYPSRSSSGVIGTDPARVGSISGTVRLYAAPAEAPPKLSPYSQPRYRPSSTPPPPPSVEEVVVYVLTSPATPTRPSAPAKITQRGMRVIPRITAVQVGTEVQFPNEDKVFHNLFSLSDPKRFNLGRYPPGHSESVVFDHPGVVRLFCDIHSEMSGVVIVLDTPFFTRPAADGSFNIPNLPAGTHTVIAWHDRAPPDTLTVSVMDGRATQVDFTLGGER